MKKPKIRVAFVDESDWTKSVITKALSEIYDLSIVSEQPTDLVFCGDGKHKQYMQFENCKKIFITCENIYPKYNVFDYSITTLDLPTKRNLRVPSYVFKFPDPNVLIKPSDFVHKTNHEKSKFCAFVVSNGNPKRTRKRMDFFKDLCAYKKVDSGGRVMNNIGQRVDDINKFLRPYKFYIAFENGSYPGYTSEKIVTAMINGCIPIYYGSPQIATEFNPKSFVSLHNFANHQQVIEHIKEIDNNEALYKRYLAEPFFNNDSPNKFYDMQRISSFLKHIIEHKRPRKKTIPIKHILFKFSRKLDPYKKITK